MDVRASPSVTVHASNSTTRALRVGVTEDVETSVSSFEIAREFV